MEQFTRVALAIAVAGMFADHACADLVGLAVFREQSGGGGPPPGPERWIYRVYAEFTNPSDRVATWGIGGILGTGQITNITLDGLPGSGFTNIPDDDSSNTAPQLPFFYTDWDTYMTIGVRYGNHAPNGVDGTHISASTPTFISNGSTLWTGEFGYVFLDPPYTQGRADYWNVGNDTNRRVLLMQLVVNAGEHVEGTIGMLWRTDSTGFTTTGIPFTSIPQPGSLVVFVALGLVRGGRRRAACLN